MKTSKKVQKTNNVQKSEKETAEVKVTALAVIHKPMMLIGGQNVPTATEEAPLSRHRLQRPQPKQTLTSLPYTQARTTTARRSMTHLCRNLPTASVK